MADVTLLADLSIPGNLLIDIGTFYLNGFNITVGGNLTINGTLKVQGSETITVAGVPITTDKLDVHTSVWLGAAWKLEFDGPGEVLVSKYSTVFFNVKMGSSKIHRFTSGVANEITINGEWESAGSPQNPAVLRSTSDGQEWFVVLAGTSTLTDKVDVRDSNAGNGILVEAKDSIDSGNVTNWDIAAAFNQLSSPLGNSTWEEILYKIRSYLNEPSEAFFMDEELMCMFNDTQMYFARETKFRKVTHEFDIIETTSTPKRYYALMPSDFLGIFSCGIQGTSSALDLTWLRSVGLAGRSTMSYQEQGFFIKNRGEIHLTREVDPTSVTLLVNFYAAPMPFTDPADLTALSYVYDEYIEDVILGTVAKAQIKRGNFEEHDRIWRMFQVRIREAQKAEGRRTGLKQIQVLK